MDSISAVIINYPVPYGPGPKIIRHTSSILPHDSIFVEFKDKVCLKTFQFEGGVTNHSCVFLDSTTGAHIIVANGATYEFDAASELIIKTFRPDVIGHLIVDGAQLVLWTYTEMQSFGTYRWQSKRLAIDELNVYGRAENVLLCEAYDPRSDEKARFSVNLIDGSLISE